MGVEIRLAGNADADAIAELHAASWRSSYRGVLSDAFLGGDILQERRRHWRECVGTNPRPDRGVLMAIEDDVCVGFICIRLEAEPTWGPLLDNLDVRPDRKSRGIMPNACSRPATHVFNSTEAE